MGSRYVLQERLGIGGMGVVHRAARRDGSADRAIKLLRPELAEDPTIRDRFIQECNLMRAMRSPNLVAVEDLIVDGDDIAIVMELVQGGTLRDHLEATGPLPPEVALDVVRQVLVGLMKVHAVGIVHRDLKPENVLLVGVPGQDGFVAKVSDFGIARLVNGPRMTGTNVFIGTPHYSAPELIEGNTPTTAADVYAAGVVLYELLSGATPFAGASGYVLMTRQLTNPAPRTDAIADPIWSLLEAWLAIDLDVRPGNAAEALEDLDALITYGQVPARTTKRNAQPDGSPRPPAVPVVVPPPSDPVGSMPGQGALKAVKKVAAPSDPDVIDLAALERQRDDATRSAPPRPWTPYEGPGVSDPGAGAPPHNDDTHLRSRPLEFGPVPLGATQALPAKPNRTRNLLIALVAILALALAGTGAAVALVGGGCTKITPDVFPLRRSRPRGNGRAGSGRLLAENTPNLHGELVFTDDQNQRNNR